MPFRFLPNHHSMSFLNHHRQPKLQQKKNRRRQMR
jgi:hypothetical protein